MVAPVILAPFLPKPTLSNHLVRRMPTGLAGITLLPLQRDMLDLETVLDFRRNLLQQTGLEVDTQCEAVPLVEPT